MKRPGFIRALLALFGAPALGARARAAGEPADLIVTGATIHTVDAAYPSPQAFAIRGGRFAYVGDLAGAMQLRGSATRVLDLRGATVLPGLIDAHLHLTSIGLALHEVDLFKVPSAEELVRRTVIFANASSDPWIFGEGWDQNLWPVKEFPDSRALSAAIPDRPVLLDRVDGHAILVNAKAMQLAGVTASTPDPRGGRIVRDADGNPTGVFIDNATDLIYRVVPGPTHEQRKRAALAAAAECHRWGVTGIGEAATSADDLAVFRELAAARQLDLRNFTRVVDDPALLDSVLAAGPVSAAHDGRLWIRGVKLFADGALGSRGAALLAPYSDDPGNTGLLRTTQAHIQEIAERALRADFQLSVHAIGDRGNRVVLDAYEAALRNVPRSGHRFRVEHAQVLEPHDIPRLAQLQLIASMQTTHQISDMGWAQDRLGSTRILGAYAWRSILDTGVIVANGTDAPVEPVNTLRTFHAAIARQNEANLPPGGWYPNQRMTREEALKSMTIWAAHANFQEEAIGSISSGKYADFVVMDRDWMSAAPEAIMGTQILATYFNGDRVYDGSVKQTAMRARRASRHTGCCA
ncbi:MAG TPA: amidohydrolase [Candidatus Acidoferrales bacterium]|nr:amidohydrolase [Candidatus Acidoferrales bacterium]